MTLLANTGRASQTTDEIEAHRTYITTGAVLIGGTKITGSDPPTPSSATQDIIDWHTSLGIPSSHILWHPVGESDT